MSNAANILRLTVVLVLFGARPAGAVGDAGAADTLTERVRQALAALAGPGKETRVEVRGVPADVAIPASPYDVRVSVPTKGRVRGTLRCEAEILVGGTIFGRFPCTAVIRTIDDVLVAERLLDRHATVGAGDAGVQRIETTECVEAPLTSLSALEGLRLRRIVPAGTILVSSLFEPVPLVTSGSEVTILVATGAIKVTTRGVARGDGGKGERVAIRPAGARAEISAVVIGDHLVQVAAK